MFVFTLDSNKNHLYLDAFALEACQDFAQKEKSIVQLLIMKLAIQIPAFNEAEHLLAVLAELPHSLPGVEEILVVVIDDGSSDDTAKVALENGADFVLRHRKNRGLSKAFINGIQFAWRLAPISSSTPMLITSIPAVRSDD